MTAKSMLRAGVIAAALLAAPVTASGVAQAQVYPPTVERVSSFDAYRALAITFGVVAGSAVAVIVTDGLIIPVYSAVTGAGSAVMGGTAAAGEGYGLMSGAIRLFGAISGGLIADSWYLDR